MLAELSAQLNGPALQPRRPDYHIRPRLPSCRREQVQGPVHNHLLRALSSEQLQELSPYLDVVALKRRQVLHERNVPITHAFFIEQGLASLLSRGMRDSMEVANLGSSDFVGLPIVLGTARSPHRCVVQVPGAALRMRAEDLKLALQDIPALRRVLFGYVQVAMVQSAQLAVCGARHTITQRIARWLLDADDRVAGEPIGVTHQALSRALGIRRAGVTTTTCAMEDAGLIQRERGSIAVVDRAALEDLSCECYRAIRAEHNRILAGAPAERLGPEL